MFTYGNSHLMRFAHKLNFILLTARLLRRTFLGVVLMCPVGVYADQANDFLAAREAYRVGDSSRLNHLAGKLKHSVLEPYLAYYQLRLQLTTAEPATVQQFLARTDNTPVINQLRAEWLKMLGLLLSM